VTDTKSRQSFKKPNKKQNTTTTPPTGIVNNKLKSAALNFQVLV